MQNVYFLSLSFHIYGIFIIFIVPNIYICTTIIFSVSLLTKSNIATYSSAVVVYALYMLSSLYFNSPIMAQSTPASTDNMAIAALVDAFGIAAFMEQSQFWTVLQKNTELVSLSGNFLANRLIWLTIGSFILGVSYHLFHFRKLNEKVKKQPLIPKEEINVQTYLPIPNLVQGVKAQWNNYLSQAKISLNLVIKSLPFLVVMLLWFIIVISEINATINEGGDYYDSLLPASYILIDLLKQPLIPLSMILLVFYSGELVWKERDLKFHGIVDATPISNTALFTAKLSVLLLLPFLLISTGILIALGFQLAKGYDQFDLSLYLSVFYYQGIRLFFYALLALCIQSLVPNKYVGMFITGAIMLAFSTSFAFQLGIEHPLLHIGRLPNISYSALAGYGNFEMPFHYFAMHWVLLGLMLTLISFKMWQRGESKANWRQLTKHWKLGHKLAFILLLVAFLCSNGVIYYHTNVLGEYQTSQERMDYREAYEKKYKHFDEYESLIPTSMQIEIDLYPKTASYQAKGNYIVINKGEQALKKVLITARTPISSLSLEGGKLIEKDTTFGTYIFQFDQPVQPLTQLKFSYEVEKKLNGFETGISILNNGSYIRPQDFAPTLGYRNSIEIKDNFERKKRGLPKLEEETISEADLTANDLAFQKVDFETIISTSEDQTAIASGDLIKQWTKNNRHYYHYKVANKVYPAINYFSGSYQVKKEKYRGISIEQYYHPSHNENIETISKSTKATLAYCMQNFGNYPYNHLRIIEIPSYWGFGGYATPGTISMVEDRLYLTDIRDKEVFNLVAKRTIHEVAHQWWGHILSPKSVDGGGIFVEGLAKYSEAVIMEQLYGKQAIWQLSKNANKRYFRGRSYADSQEPPLYLENGSSYLLYGKSFTVMLALRELIGENTLNQVLKKLVDKHKGEVEPELISLELLDELYQVTPQNYHSLIDDWFKRIITYDLEAKEATYKKLADGTYEITLIVSAKRFELDSTTGSKSISINEPIAVGVFTKHPKKAANTNSILYLKAHEINQEQQQIVIKVKELPKYISIDPYGTRLDKKWDDNTIEVIKN